VEAKEERPGEPGLSKVGRCVRSQLPHPKAQEIALNDAMILSYDANLGRMEFSEGQHTGVIRKTMSPRANQTAADRPEFLAWQNARSRTLAAEGGLQTRLT